MIFYIKGDIFAVSLLSDNFQMLIDLTASGFGFCLEIELAAPILVLEF